MEINVFIGRILVGYSCNKIVKQRLGYDIYVTNMWASRLISPYFILYRF